MCIFDVHEACGETNNSSWNYAKVKWAKGPGNEIFTPGNLPYFGNETSTLNPISSVYCACLPIDKNALRFYKFQARTVHWKVLV